MAIKHASDAHKSRELAANRYSVVFSAQAFNLGDARPWWLSEPIGAIPRRGGVVVKVEDSNNAFNHECKLPRGALRTDELSAIVRCVRELDTGDAKSAARARHQAILFGIAILGILAISLEFVRAGATPAFLQTQALSVGSEQSHHWSTENRMRTLKSIFLASSLVVGTTALAQDAVEWRVADGGNGHWYQLIISGPITWTAARAACGEIGGHLVTPTSASENAFVTQIGNRAEHPAAWVNDFGGNAGGPWLGGYQPSDASIVQPWAWVTDEPWGSAGWAPGEPNGGYGPGVSITAMLGYSGSNYYRGWADAGLTDFPLYPLSPSYILEYSADCNNDGIVDYGQIRTGDLDDLNANNIPDCCEQSTNCDPCAADVDQSGAVNGVDLAGLLNNWGTSGGKQPRSDIDGSGIVDAEDLTYLLDAWGACP
ncbi:MAG: hypothetical protein DWH96_02370 [Planctomycetota bacterium]|nr:MAG: hypothetical protein DWH96_02370 [Planctomycetota bacterium]